MKPRAIHSALDRLVAALTRLPGVGNRSAHRLAFHLLKAPPEETRELAEALVNLRDHSKTCSVCGNLTEKDPCAVCVDASRDHGLVMVVEQPSDLASVEATGLYKGVYHLLMGRVAPLDDVGPGELNIEALLERVRSGRVREVILGTNPTTEGDGTALYLADQLAQMGVKVTRLARGLPSGAPLEWASKAVLAEAIQGRQDVG